MALPRRTGRSRLTLALLILTSLAVLTLDFRDAGIVESARRAASTVFSPLRGAARTVTEPFTNGWEGITGYGDLEDENAELQARIDELEGERIEGEAAIKERDKLLKELNIAYLGGLQRVTARVTYGAVSNFSHTVEIDKGTADGVREGMPVVNGDGLVGRVQQATGSSSTIQLLTDPEFAVGVRMVDDDPALDGTEGTARGAGEGDPLVVDTGLDGDTVLEPGDVLLTSGADRSAFPPQIPVGTVRGTKEAGGGLTLDLLVEPSVDTTRLSYVTVVLWEGDQ